MYNGKSGERKAIQSVELIFDSGDEFTNRATFRRIMTNIKDAEAEERLLEKEYRRRKANEHINDLISNSTLHGLHFCFDKRHFIRRICWTLLILVALGLLVQKLYESTTHFFSYPFSTTTTIKYEEDMLFPAVSLCNLNDMRMSVMNGTKLHKAIQKGNILALDGKEYTDTIRKANHRLEDMLKVCKIKGTPCSVKNFTQFNHNQGDRCFTFNSGHIGHKLIRVNNTGLQHSLEMVIDIEHHDYYPDTQHSGIHLILHGQDETPVKMQGIMLSTGFATYIKVTKRKVINLPYPYETNCGKLALKYFKGYSKHLCWLEKLTETVVTTCGCKDWFMPGDHRVCSLNESVSCMWPVWTDFDKNKRYDCPVPCVIDTYKPSISTAVYPSNNQADMISKKLNLAGSKSENREWVRDNYLKFYIYYEELSYELVEEKPSYSLFSLLGNIGGLLGLFLGSSVLTYFEFLDCFAMFMYTKFFAIFTMKPTSS